MSFQLMKARIKQSGDSLYNEQIKDAQDILRYDFCNDVSYNPNIYIYKTSKNIPLKMYDQKYSASYGSICKFLSPHDFPINLGEILYNESKKEYWLCIESYDVSNIHNEGKLGKCSRFIKWQDKYGAIHEIPVICRNATQYNNGEYRDEKIYLGSDQIMMYTQLNELTKKLDHGIRFFVDENKEEPSVYELTKPDTVDYSYMGTGMISLMLTECPYTPTDDELILGVCNYKAIKTSFPSSDGISISSISGTPKLKVGIPKTYSVDFFDKDKNKIDWKNIYFKWNIISDFDVVKNIYEDKIEIIVDNEDYIDSSFLLQIIINDNVDSEMKISVIDIV